MAAQGAGGQAAASGCGTTSPKKDEGRAAELDQGDHARSRSGPQPGGTCENEAMRAGLRPEANLEVAERAQGRTERPFLAGEHGCPDRDRTLFGQTHSHAIRSRFHFAKQVSLCRMRNTTDFAEL